MSSCTDFDMKGQSAQAEVKKLKSTQTSEI